jgi:hypothetical protein
MGQRMTATWRFKNGLARWGMDARERPAGDPRQWFREAAVTAVSLLDGFAVAEHAWLTTEAEGELDEPTLLAPDDPAGALAAALAAHEDIYAVMVSLALLLVTEPSALPQPFPRSARLSVELDSEQGREPFLHLFLSIDTDIYAVTTWAEDRDNRVLAALNGPKLTRFLTALQDRLGAVVTEITAYSYPGQVDATGFVPAS